MASQPPVNPQGPNVMPQQAPPQRWTPPPRRRSIFGPIFLIGMGVVLLLVSSGRISMREFFVWFAQYWPLILILWGVVKLFEYMQAKREGLPAPGIGAGGIVLMIFLIMFGLSASGFKRVNWGNVRSNMEIDDEDFASMFGGNKYQYDDSVEKDFPANGSLKVTVDRGDINVVPSSDNKLHIAIKKTLYADNEQEAKKTSDNFSPNITLTDNVMTVEALPRGDWKGRVDLQVSVPRKAAIDLMTLRGTLTVNGRDGNVNAHNSNGDVNVQDVAGNVTAHMRGGNLDIKQVKGDATFEGRGNDVRVSDIGGRLNLQGEYDSIQMSNIDKNIHFNSTRTDMEMVKLDGDLNMSNGELRANKITGPFRVSTRSKDIELEDITGDIKVDNSNGQVQITPNKPIANIDVANKNGEVTLMLPGDGNFSIDATSARGEIESDFDLNQAFNSGHEQHSTGNVGKGGPRIQVRDEHATIRLRKR